MIFVVIAGPGRETVLAERIHEFYGNKSIALHATPGQWFVASNGTAEEVSTRLGITADKPDDIAPAIVLAVAGYWGREAPNIWEWLALHGD